MTSQPLSIGAGKTNQSGLPISVVHAAVPYFPSSQEIRSNLIAFSLRGVIVDSWENWTTGFLFIFLGEGKDAIFRPDTVCCARDLHLFISLKIPNWTTWSDAVDNTFREIALFARIKETLTSMICIPTTMSQSNPTAGFPFPFHSQRESGHMLADLNKQRRNIWPFNRDAHKKNTPYVEEDSPKVDPCSFSRFFFFFFLYILFRFFVIHVHGAA